MSDPATANLTEFEIAILTFFYHQHRFDLLEEINRPQRRDERKAAILRLESIGFLFQEEPFAFKITHEGHVFLDHLAAQGNEPCEP